MKIIRGHDLSFVPATHEDALDPGVLKKVLLKKDELNPGRIQMINWAKIPVGRSFASHHHEDMEEIFIVMSGKSEVVVGNEADILEPGDTVIIPENNNHVMKNIGDTEVEYIVIGITRQANGKTIVA